MANNAAALTKLILLIDGENIAAKYADWMIEQARDLGTLADIRLYGHSASLRGWSNAVKKHRITKVDVPQAGANSADFKLAIEALDILHHRQLDGLCIASSDAGFAVLVDRIRSAGLSAYGFLESDRSNEAYAKSFDRYFECQAQPKQEELRTESRVNARQAAKVRASAPPKPKAVVTPRAVSQATAAKTKPQAPGKAPNQRNTLTPQMILDAVRETRKEDEGWARLQQVGQYLRDHNPRLPKPLRLWQHVQKIPDLEFWKKDGAHFVRLRSP